MRDQIHYFPFSQFDRRAAYRATATLDRGVGYCVQKAVVLVTLARAAGFPTALTCVDIRNQRAASHIVEMMGSDLKLGPEGEIKLGPVDMNKTIPVAGTAPT